MKKMFCTSNNILQELGRNRGASTRICGGVSLSFQHNPAKTRKALAVSFLRSKTGAPVPLKLQRRTARSCLSVRPHGPILLKLPSAGAPLLCIPEVQRTNLVPQTGNPDCGFARSSSVHTEMCRYISPKLSTTVVFQFASLLLLSAPTIGRL